MTSPWEAPESPAGPSSGLPVVLGFVAVLVLHGAVFAVLSFMAPAVPSTWSRGFGVLQLGFLAPLTAGLVALGAPRRAVWGVFTAAVLAFVLNALLYGLGWGGA